MEPYSRVSCDFYDKLVMLAKESLKIKIRYLNDGDKKCLIEATIKDVKIMDSAEWLILDNGEKLRLDRILEADNVIVRYEME